MWLSSSYACPALGPAPDMPEDIPPPKGDSEYWLAWEPGRVPGVPPPGVLNPLPGPPPYGEGLGLNPAPGPPDEG